MASPKTTVEKLVIGFTSRKPMRSTSLIITVFGDVISCHGGVIWLGSLVKAMSLMGINDRLVRTSVFRLVKEDWLCAERVGRRSYYRFTAYGENEYQRAASRIYGEPKNPWNGRWQLLLVRDIEEPVIREKVRRSLQWQGFRSISPGVFAKPESGGISVMQTLEEFGVKDQVIPMEASTFEGTSKNLLSSIVAEHWHLEDVADRYKVFLRRFDEINSLLDGGITFSMADAFVVRVLLIHDLRRAILQDIRLPDEILPVEWPGRAAEKLAANIYQKVGRESVEYIRSELEADKGLMGQGSSEFVNRFKGAF